MSSGALISKQSALSQCLRQSFACFLCRGVESIAIPDWLTLAPGVQTKPRVETVVPGTLDRIIGMLSVAAEELPDCPFYFQSDKLCSTVRTPVPKISLLR
ncbi:unnamed protein product [Hymenolepis diminuta]|uniref:Transposase n=1 Tax=Hymenolepis diminuta TaxID=6216 RepID=A0A0R3SFM7_HYMDI|nr:unnamed protein product [Hymenolepis diminuta]